MKKSLLSICVIFVLLVQTISVVCADTQDFSDVPNSHWAYTYINKLRTLNITNGVGENKFGVGKTITRAEFVAFLCNLLQYEKSGASVGSFSDNQDTKAWFFPYVETALQKGVIDNQSQSAKFRPKDAITREEMAVMIVRALGYDELAQRLTYLGNPFPDVTSQTGYITIAKDFGIVSGMGDGRFMPKETATREQAATMMIRMYDGLHGGVQSKNAFYAINSASQMDAIPAFDSDCFGWARLQVNAGTVEINTTSADGNEYYVPQGYEKPYQLANGKDKLLMIAVDNTNASSILKDPQLVGQAVTIMSAGAVGIQDGAGATIPFDGVVVDFEGLKGEEMKSNFNTFLTSLRDSLTSNGKKMYVAVHPKRRTGHEYYDGYDYKTIGQLADKVILMAHDYNVKQLTPEEMEQGIVMTPVAPIEEIYYALRAITDKETGVQDTKKIMLQISFDTAQWKLVDKKVINDKPYFPSYDAIVKRIQSGAELKYSTKYESPYMTFYNQEDTTDNVVWYEDERSVDAKVKMASLFGVGGVSLWRLGNIPDGGHEQNLGVLQKVKAWGR